MKTKIFEPLLLKFEKPDWALNPEFGLIDTILEQHPELFLLLEKDIVSGNKISEFGRKDVPSVERIVRAALYKELKQLNYRELEYHQADSRICDQFLKIDGGKKYSFQTYQKYISKINQESLDNFLIELNKISITEGLEDIDKLRMDSTVIETNIHYPTNNALVWDCIKESHRLLSTLSKELKDVSYRNYLKGAKKTYYKINVVKGKGSVEKRAKLFAKQLVTFTKSINQVSNVVKKKETYKNISIKALVYIVALEQLLPLMQKVYDFTNRREIMKENVPQEDKIYSIYELHTDIIIKGSRDVKFGHKVNFSSGKSNLILSCETLKGNPADSNLFQTTIAKVIADYKIVPKSSATDGGYTSKKNLDYALDQGIKNVVFNKIVGSMKNVTSSLNMETRLKKWRSGMEAIISNFKRKFKMSRCNWKGLAHFKSKVLWSAIAYNIRVMTGLALQHFIKV